MEYPRPGIEMVIYNIQDFEYNLTLKNDYTEELAKLEEYERCVRQLQNVIWNSPKHKLEFAFEKVRSIREWIMQELENN